MKKIAAFAFLACILSFSSCSIEKRVHQDGFHISWKHRHAAAPHTTEDSKSISPQEVVTLEKTTPPNVHSAQALSANNEENLNVLPRKKNVLTTKTDTVVPDQKSQQEEYFTNNYTAPIRPDELPDSKLANWALGLGIGAVSTPLWGTLLFLTIGTTSGFSWALLGVAVLVGSLLFLALEITSLILGINFLKKHAKDPNYRKFRSRAITGIILAGIYPALILINILLAALLTI